MLPRIDAGVVRLLSEADLETGRLDATMAKRPDREAFVGLALRAEALASGRVEGDELGLAELLRLEDSPALLAAVPGGPEASRWLEAFDHGTRRLASRPPSLRLVRELEERLGLSPDEPGSERLEAALSEARGPALLQAGVASALPHAGKAGRLLVLLLLGRRGALRSPVLRWSRFAAAHAREYAELRNSVRNAPLGSASWTGWLSFFLRGAAAEARAALALADRSHALHASHVARLDDVPRAGTLRKALDVLRADPIVSVASLAERLRVTFVTAEKTVGRLADLGLLEEVTGRRRGRRFLYAPWVRLFETGKGA